MRPCYVFDIDGTLADCSHRVHHIKKDPKDWDAYYAGCRDDLPIRHMIDLARILAAASDAPIVYVSGRRESCREDTVWWLFQHYLPHQKWLYLREDGDHRGDDILKIEILQKIRSEGLEPVLAFDDRTRVVNAWRNAGIPCCQVAPGDF